MQFYELTTETTADGKRIVRVAGRIADHRRTDEQAEWITFQLATDLPTVRNGAILRSEILELIREKLHPLRIDFERLGREH